MIRVGVIGATGYAGAELVRLICGHPQAMLTEVVSKSYAGQPLSDLYPNLKGIVDLVCQELDCDRLAQNCDVVFTALPHGVSAATGASLIERGVRVVDLSADFRYTDVDVYEAWYKVEHPAKELLQEAVYGLCELHREEIQTAQLIGNPGCYTTCSILGAAPLLANHVVDPSSLIIDAKSGVTGAGRGLAIDFHFCECTENTKAYKVATHRHTSEIEQELSLLSGEPVVVSFTPHLIPQKRGILASIYGNLIVPTTTEELLEQYRAFYQGEQFVRIYDAGKLPETNHVAGSNYVDIGLTVDPRTNRVIVISCIDNLFKGAAGQAVQNMNIMFGLEESMGIDQPGFYL